MLEKGEFRPNISHKKKSSDNNNKKGGNKNNGQNNNQNNNNNDEGNAVGVHIAEEAEYNDDDNLQEIEDETEALVLGAIDDDTHNP